MVKNAEGKTLVHVVYEKDGLEQQVFSDDGQVRPGLYYTPKMLSALGYSPGFPLELQLNPVVPVTNLSIPATPFHESPRALKDGLIKQKIYVTPTECFDGTFRDVFRDHISGVESHKWLPSPNMDY